VARQKEIEGRIIFSTADNPEGSSSNQVFDQFVEVLTQRFRVTVEEDLGALVTVPAVRPPPQGNDRNPAGIDTPGLAYETIPFTVALTFRERGIQPFYRRFEEHLLALLRKLTKYIPAVAPVVGAAIGDVPAAVVAGGATLMSALGKFLNDSPKAAESTDLAKAAKTLGDSVNSFSVSGARQLFEQWQQSNLKDLHLNQVTEDDWKTFIDKVKEASPADTPKDTAATKEVVAPFELTQLLGWLTKNDKGEYGFRIDGLTRYEDDAVEYDDGARLDILGPDGSQLITQLVSELDLRDWLVGNGKKGFSVNVRPANDLRRAFERQSFRDDNAKFSHSIRGRFWFSDGSAFGIRTVAIYVPPDFSRPIDECAAEGEFASDDSDCCTGDEFVRQEVIRAPEALAVTQTDENGYFTFTYNRSEPFTAANALIQISGLRAAVALRLVKAPGAQAAAFDSSSFPNPILLQVDAALRATSSPNAGNAIEWVDGDKDTDDCGCQGLRFNDRNRALEEFKFDIVVRTTDPMVTRSNIDLTSAATTPVASQEITPDTVFRKSLAREESIEWDGSPRITQAVTVSHGRVLTIKQIWRSDGYSLGDLLYSLPLAPLQKKNVAVIDWGRRSDFSMDSAQSDIESLNNLVSRDRDISEITNSLYNESLRGRSDSGGNSSSAGGGISLLGFGFGGASGGSSSAWSSSSQDSTRSLAGNFLNSLRDQTTQAANALRAQRVTTVQQISQSESANAMSETVANRNACHAVTIEYFEVLRNLRVDYELAGVRECLNIPMPLSRFDPQKAARWCDSLRPYLPSPSMLDGLDACSRLLEVDYPALTYADETVNDLDGEMQVTLDFPYPTQKPEDLTWQRFFGFDYATNSSLATLFEALKSTPDAARAQYFGANVAPILARDIVASLRLSADTLTRGSVSIPVKATLLTPYSAGRRHYVSLRATGDIKALGISRREIKGFWLSTIIKSDSRLCAIINSLELRYSTDHFRFKLLSRQNEDLGVQWDSAADTGKAILLSTPLQRDELVNPKLEDTRAQDKLIRHLNQHVEYYHKAIWWTMDPDRRFTLLDGYIAPNAGGRSIASVVENRLVAIIGNCLVMPVAPGIRLDYYDEVVEEADEAAAVDLARKEANESDADRLLTLYRPLIQIPSTSHAIPTKGVYAESVMGSCNSCEKMDDKRNWRYWEHPLPDEPTKIEPLSLASRALKEDQEAPKLAQPIINQVATSIPQAPDPTGLGKVIEAMTKNPGFPDMAGLAGTQQNARDALAQTFATTTKFGESAAEITKQLNELVAKAIMAYFTDGASLLTDTGSAAKVKDSIGKDADAGRVTPEQAQNSFAKVNDALADSLAPTRIQSVLQHPQVAAAIGAAAERGAPLTVSKDGTRVDIGSSPPKAKKAGLWPWPFRLFGGGSNEEDSSPRPAGTQREWIGKQFDVVSSSNPRRTVGLTLSLDTRRWSAIDPRGIINPDEGTWQSNNYVNTACLANGKVIVDLISCGILNVTVGQSGVANVAQAGDDFTWQCTNVIYMPIQN
jgi:hypothetical protein